MIEPNVRSGNRCLTRSRYSFAKIMYSDRPRGGLVGSRVEPFAGVQRGHWWVVLVSIFPVRPQIYLLEEWRDEKAGCDFESD